MVETSTTANRISSTQNSLNPLVLEAIGVSKRFGIVQAVDTVDFALRRGEVHALVGSNGAGKSTLVKILTGALASDTGELKLDGKPFAGGSTKAALEAGIAGVYQHSQLVPVLPVMDNILLGRQPTFIGGILNRKAQRQRVAQLLARYDLQLDLDVPALALSPVQQKEVEIAKALSVDARVILMDEPTAALSQSEVKKLFAAIHQLREQGVAILYISHVLDEIFEIADRVTVIRNGQVHLSASIAEVTKQEVVETMLGKELASTVNHLVFENHPAVMQEVALECRNLSKKATFNEINLKIYKGEIVCITGLVGSKRSELVRALFGAEPADKGEILVFGKAVRMRHPLDAIRQGIGFVPEDRRHDGLFMDLPIRSNIVMAILDKVTRGGILVQQRIKKVSKENIGHLNIVPPRTEVLPSTLSGGNQQKVLLARWLAGDTRVLILDEPTVGIDVGTKANIYNLLRQLAAKGTAVLVVSSDLEEVMSVADRIVVMSKGRITGNFSRQAVTQEEIMKAASGEIS
jgi:ABC-type sugar transport system ATPase subunit